MSNHNNKKCKHITKLSHCHSLFRVQEKLRVRVIVVRGSVVVMKCHNLLVISKVNCFYSSSLELWLLFTTKTNNLIGGRQMIGQRRDLRVSLLVLLNQRHLEVRVWDFLFQMFRILWFSCICNTRVFSYFLPYNTCI